MTTWLWGFSVNGLVCGNEKRSDSGHVRAVSGPKLLKRYPYPHLTEVQVIRPLPLPESESKLRAGTMSRCGPNASIIYLCNVINMHYIWSRSSLSGPWLWNSWIRTWNQMFFGPRWWTWIWKFGYPGAHFHPHWFGSDLEWLKVLLGIPSTKCTITHSKFLFLSLLHLSLVRRHGQRVAWLETLIRKTREDSNCVLFFSPLNKKNSSLVGTIAG